MRRRDTGCRRPCLCCLDQGQGGALDTSDWAGDGWVFVACQNQALLLQENEVTNHAMEEGTAILGHFFHLVKDSFPLMDQESDYVQSLKGGLILVDRDNGMVSDFGSKEELSNRPDDHQVDYQLDDFLVPEFVALPINLTKEWLSSLILISCLIAYEIR